MKIKRRAIDDKTRNDIAGAMHIEFLRSIMRHADTKNLAFHGGTSLHIVHGSPRFSEDLDFIVSTAIRPRLEEMVSSAARSAAACIEISHADHGLQVEWRSKGRTKENGMFSGMLVASSDRLHGTVKVKVECYPTVPDAFAGYIATPVLVRDTMIRSANLKTIMADKIVALAMRPYFKERDLFDIWWLSARHVQASVDDIMASASIYGYSADEIINGLNTIEARMPDTEAVAQNLKQWLDRDTYDNLMRSDAFSLMRKTGMDVAQAASQAIQFAAPTPCGPGQ